MRHPWRATLLALVVTMPVAVTGCVGQIMAIDAFLDFFLRGLGVGGFRSTASTAAAKAPKVRESIPVHLSGSIGGLSGGFQVTVGPYGTLTGTADIKGRKRAALKVKDDAQIAALIQAVVLDVTGAQVDVTKSKTAFKGSQTTGGVRKKYKCKVAWKGTVVDGPAAGTAVSGKLKTKGAFE